MNSALNSGMYWMMSGLPYMMSLPTTRSRNGGRWDGSRWVNTSANTSSSSTLPSALAPTYSSGGERDTTFGADAFSGPSGMSGAFSNAALGQAAFGAAKDTLGSTLGSLGKTAAVNGVLGGLATGNIGAGIASALGSVANPGTFAGALGNLTNSAFGLTGVPGSVMGIASGIMGAINPGLGLATSMFGGFALDGLMDAFDARSMEAVRDMAEQMAGDYFGGRMAGATLANDFQTAMANPSISNYAPTAAVSLASLGAVPTSDLVQDMTTAAFASIESPAIAAALGEISMDAMSPAQQAAIQSLGLDVAHAGLQANIAQTAIQQSLNALGGIDGVAGRQIDGALTNKDGLTNTGLFSGISIDPNTGMAYRDDPISRSMERAPSFDTPNLTDPTVTQGPTNTGVSSGMTAGTVADAIDAGISAGLGAIDGTAEDTSGTSSTGSDSDDSDSDSTGSDGGGGDNGGNDSDGPSGGGGMSGGSGIGGGSDSDDSDSDSDSDD